VKNRCISSLRLPLPLHARVTERSTTGYCKSVITSGPEEKSVVAGGARGPSKRRRCGQCRTTIRFTSPPSAEKPRDDRRSNHHHSLPALQRGTGDGNRRPFQRRRRIQRQVRRCCCCCCCCCIPVTNRYIAYRHLRSRCGHAYFALWFLLSSSFFLA